MKKIQIVAALAAGWSAFMRRPWYLLGLTLSFAFLCVISSGDGAFSALAYVIYGGYILVLIKHFRGSVVEFDDLFAIDHRWISYAFLAIIKGILIVLGFLCFILPGIYLIVRWSFAEILVLDQGMRPIEALRASSKMTEGVRWKLFALFIIAILMVAFGALLLGVGAIVAALVVNFAAIYLYEERKFVLVTPESVPAPDSNQEEVVA